MPKPVVALPWGSRSTRRVERSARASPAARFTAVVVLPTPPFWLTTAMVLAMPRSYTTPGVPRFTQVAHVFHESHSAYGRWQIVGFRDAWLPRATVPGTTSPLLAGRKRRRHPPP